MFLLHLEGVGPSFFHAGSQLSARKISHGLGLVVFRRMANEPYFILVGAFKDRFHCLIWIISMIYRLYFACHGASYVE